MLRHPRDRSSSISRREFLRRAAAAGIALPSAAAILAACQGGDDTTTTSDTGVGFNLTPSPDDPVTMPIYDDNPAIASNLEPETDTVFKVFNWTDYYWKKKLEEFGAMYDVEVEYTNFYNMEQAVERLRTGDLDADVFFPTIDQLGRLVAGKLLQPINHDYVGTFDNVWAELQSPFYDQESRYSVPYVIYTTGVGFLRTAIDPDEVFAMENPYEILWDERFAGKVGVYDDFREAIAMSLLKNGIADVNTEDPADIDVAKNDLIEMVNTVDARFSINGAYAKLPQGVFDVHQAWSGDMIGAQYYTGNDVTAEDLAFWFPEEGGGVIGNDLMAIPATANNPVLAHLFLDFSLDAKHGLENFSWVGYQPPLKSMEADTLVADGYVHESVANAVVGQGQFKDNVRYLALSAEGEQLWLEAWEEISSGASQGDS
ncbi:MAG: spermidine/putrescine ABC transporter substrate-binding protein [Actinomycetota bacterium]